MFKKSVAALVFFFLLTLFPANSFAAVSVGPLVSIADPATFGGSLSYDLIEDWWTARVFYGVNSLSPTTVTSFDLYLTDRFRIREEGVVAPYAGFGFSFVSGNVQLSRVSKASANKGLSFIGGLEYPLGSSPWYVDLNYTTGSGAINLSVMYEFE